MIFNNHNEFVIFDIGERYIKAILIRLNWGNSIEYVYATQISSKGIDFNSINNLRSLSDAIFQLIYRIEVDVGTAVKEVGIIFSFASIQKKVFYSSLKINNSVTEANINDLNTRMSLGLDKYIIGYLFKNYQIDNLINIEDPLYMCGNNLSLQSCALLVDKPLVQNLITCFNRNDIRINYMGVGLLTNDILVHSNRFIGIDVGFSSTRIVIKIKEENIFEFMDLSMGLKNLIKELEKHTGKPIKEVEKIISLSYENSNREIVDITRKYIKELFKEVLFNISKLQYLNKVVDPIYLFGGISVVPMIELYLQQTFDREFIIQKIAQNFNSVHNRNIFQNILAFSEYLTKSTKLINIVHIE